MDDLVHETLPQEELETVGGPTPSAYTNRLIARCLEAAAGRLDTENLRQALEACGNELSEAKGAFSTQVHEEPGLVEALPEPIEAVLDAFDAYGEALAGARSWLTRQEPQILWSAADSLTEAYNELHDSLLAYEWAYLSHGDEPHPALNLMQKVMSALRQGLMEDDRFDEILDHLWDHFTRGIETFEQDADPARALRGARACREALAGIQTMDEYLEGHDLKLLERGFTQFRQGCLLLVEQIQDSIGEALIQAPTPSPQVNWVIHAARAVMDGLAVGLLQRAQAWFEPQLSESYFRFEQCATAALKGPARMAEQVSVAREGFDWLNRALPLLRLGVERRELLPRAIEHLEEGAALLYEAWMILSLIENEESSTFCPRCGSSNPVTNRVCDACGASLRSVEKTVAIPGIAPGMPEAGGPAHLQRLLVACEDVEAGRMGHEEFASVLVWAEQILKSADLGLTRLPQDGEMAPEIADAVEGLRQGMAEFRAALYELNEFVQDGRPVHLSDGTRLLVLAFERLVDVKNRAGGV